MKNMIKVWEMISLKKCFIAFLFGIVYSQTDQMHVQNLDDRCLRCLCFAATNCDISYGCQRGYCGAYRISRVYWADAKKVVLPNDNANRTGAFEDCAKQLECSNQIIKNYMEKYGRDCNGDGVTDCNDFMMVHANGGIQCDTSLERSESGRNWTRRFSYCSPSL